MSDSATDQTVNSKENLIEVQHVGVTAKIRSPLAQLIQCNDSSTETDVHQCSFNSIYKPRYDKFRDESQVETASTAESSKVLYEMHTIRGGPTNRTKATPTKIEFQLYRRPLRNMRHWQKVQQKRNKSKAQKRKYKQQASEFSIFKCLRQSLGNMRVNSNKEQLIDGLPKPNFSEKPCWKQQTHQPGETRINIYPFEHGCAECLRTTDSHPELVTLQLAERATHYATRFWAELFGVFYIGVSFLVTFLLQSYRFVLYSLINTLLVRFLCMTSDYLLKPLLTVVFNGFLQPPLIFIFNILTSVRDILEPVADTINNFMKPVATVGRSLRLISQNSNQKQKV